MLHVCRSVGVVPGGFNVGGIYGSPMERLSMTHEKDDQHTLTHHPMRTWDEGGKVCWATRAVGGTVPLARQGHHSSDERVGTKGAG